ncbi:urease subunit beta [Streptomyces sp. NPDC002795]|uniref:urease subunit beta n=1 Tax=Streptomyces sp. NPDC002795 TaxID=3364665 RepID=UPI00367B00F0
MIPGEIRVGEAPLPERDLGERRTLVFVNDGDRPIQVGSHLHLPLANPHLSFDRAMTEGFRLDVPAGTSVRFEPGVSQRVGCVRLAGTRFGDRPEREARA